VQIARRIESMVRADDIVARLGGSDFVVVAHRVGSDADAHTLGQKLTAGLRKPIRLSSGAYKVNVRIGYAVAPEHGDDASQLLRRADLEMFDSRQMPRGNLVRYDPNAWPIEEEAGRSRSSAGGDTAAAQLDDESAAAAAVLGENGASAGPVTPPAAAPNDTAARRRPEAAQTDPARVDAASTDTIGT
jgi:predicted signal transduction protein with EAL and GGDEF domain